MEKLKGALDRFEGELGIIRTNGDEITIPKKYLNGYKEGDIIALTLANEKMDTEDANKVAKALISDLLKEE